MVDSSARPKSNWDNLLPGFLAGDPGSCEQFVSSATPYVRRIAQSLAYDLAKDIHGEIVQQALLDTSRLGQQQYDPAKMTAKQFLRGQAWNAVRVVRDQYTHPGQPKRPRRTKKETGLPMPTTQPAKVVNLEETAEVEDNSARGAFDQIEARIDAERICRTAPPRTRAALHLMRQGCTLPEAARRTGQTRFRLRYALRVFGSRCA